MNPLVEIQEYDETRLTPETALAIAGLTSRCFERSGRSLTERVTRMLQAIGSQSQEHTTGRRFVIWQNEQPVAHARTFVRSVFTNGMEIPVLALASVCTEPSLRRSGFGAKVTQRAFEQIGVDGWPAVSLFQTPVPQFYQRLNCRVVSNRFVNGLDQENLDANPWTDENIMIYPTEFEWPDGLIDLNGPDY